MKNLRMALVGERSAIAFYRRLLDMAPNDEHRKQIEHAYEDEKKHYRMFENLYIRLTGRRPDVKPMTVTFATYEEGLKKAFYDELEAAELYRDTQLLTRNKAIRDIFYEAMTDEMEHAARFSFIYHQL
ncbi:MAG: ferritin-like domain-containing protein [Calditerricola sp.]|jgi:Uncharacterized conserved protein|nr:ferritin-like domain-containing protein [Calditerricola sp.]